MAASIEESLIQKLRGLPPEQQREVLNFVEIRAANRPEAKDNLGRN